MGVLHIRNIDDRLVSETKARAAEGCMTLYEYVSLALRKLNAMELPKGDPIKRPALPPKPKPSGHNPNECKLYGCMMCLAQGHKDPMRGLTGVLNIR